MNLEEQIRLIVENSGLNLYDIVTTKETYKLLTIHFKNGLSVNNFIKESKVASLGIILKSVDSNLLPGLKEILTN